VNLILLTADELDDDRVARLTGARAGHVCRVLDAAIGQEIRVGILDGPIGRGQVISRTAGEVLVRCTFVPSPPPVPAVDLLLALPRPKVMRRLWAQLAALGVGHVVLTNAARVERNYFDAHVLSPGCYEPLLVEGLQQARDTRLPRVSIHRQFRPLVEDRLDELCGPGLRLIAEPGVPAGIAETVADRDLPRVLLAIGPEGGWNDFERQLLAARGFYAVSMGTRSLRSDTACVALLALVHDALRSREGRRI
jgi:16S rRNA (uracil1498-N3)-methyltransferase